MSETSDDALDAKAVAKLLGVSYRTVLNLASNGEIAAFTVGSKVRFTRAAVDRYIEKHPKEKK